MLPSTLRRLRTALGAAAVAAALALTAVGSGGAPSGAVDPATVTWVGVPCITTGSEVVEGVTVSVTAYSGDGAAQCGTSFDAYAFYMGQAVPTGSWTATQTITFAAPVPTLRLRTLYNADGTSETFTVVAKDSGGSAVGSPHVYANVDQYDTLEFPTPVASIEVTFASVTGTASLIYFFLPEVPVTVTADSPAAIPAGTALPLIGYSSEPATVAADWITEPVCAVYVPADDTYSTPLTGVQPPGTYVTHCGPGDSASYSNLTYADGTLVVSPAPPTPEPSPEPTFTG